MPINRFRLATVSVLAASLGFVAIAGPSIAQDDPQLEEPSTETQPSPPTDAPPGVPDEIIECEISIEDVELWEPSAEEIAEMNEEADALIAYLDKNGVTVEVETDEMGIRYPAFDENIDEAVWELVDQFYADRYGDEFPEDCEAAFDAAFCEDGPLDGQSEPHEDAEAPVEAT